MEKSLSDWKGKAHDRRGEFEEKLKLKDDEINQQWLRIRELERENVQMRELIDTFEASELIFLKMANLVTLCDRL